MWPASPAAVRTRSRAASLVGAALLAGVALLAACGTDLDAFTITRSGSTTVQGSTLTNLLQPLGFGGLADMDLSQSSEFANQGVEKHQVDSVKLTRLSLKVTAPPSGQDLTFLDKIEFFAESPGLETQLVASGGPFPAGAKEVQLTMHGVELKPYVTADKMSLTTKVSGQPPAQDTTIEATVTMRVDVDVSGVVTGK